MIDLILTSPGEGPATLFTRNFRVHAGIPVGLYEGGPRAPVVLVYGDISSNVDDWGSLATGCKSDYSRLGDKDADVPA